MCYCHVFLFHGSFGNYFGVIVFEFETPPYNVQRTTTSEYHQRQTYRLLWCYVLTEDDNCGGGRRHTEARNDINWVNANKGAGLLDGDKDVLRANTANKDDRHPLRVERA